MTSDSEDRIFQSPFPTDIVPTPHCFNMQELPVASTARTQVIEILTSIKQDKTLSPSQLEFQSTPLYTHLSYGLVYTIGSALGYQPPTTAVCLAAFQVSNSVGLTAGARAWTKHAHRSQYSSNNEKPNPGWWGFARGPVAVLNEGAHKLFYKVLDNASWRNLHMLPHAILAYEARVPEGYGMRWSRNLSLPTKDGETIGFHSIEEGHKNPTEIYEQPWVFRGFLEPMIENGHEVGWRHRPVDSSVSVDSLDVQNLSTHSA